MSSKESPKIYTVSEFNRLVQKTLEEQYSDVWIEGEISNYRGASSSGHCYFSLKDESSQVDIVAFRGVMASLRFKLEEGLKVLVCGKASLYPQRGRFQIIAQFLEPRGAGALQLAFEQLKKKLEAEGLFDPARKKPIPALPRRIGIVTSPTGAAIRDVLTVIDRRFANVEIVICPVKVQGEGAAEEISEGIKLLNEKFGDLDVLLVGRGGGSIEDLWAFNEEIVARAIFASKIPVISCIGHEIDFTIADFVSDLRAPTPSAAAELVVKSKKELQSTLNNLYVRLKNSMEAEIENSILRLQSVLRSPAISAPEKFYEEQLQNLDYLLEKMEVSEARMRTARENQLALLKSKIMLLSPQSPLNEKEQFLRSEMARFAILAAQKIRQWNEQIKYFAGKLDALSPLAVLSRGYAIAWYRSDGKGSKENILKSSLQVKVQDSIRIKLHQGGLKATVDEIIYSSPLPSGERVG